MNEPSKDKKDPAESGIDWTNVASEARTMVELNRTAMERWQPEAGEGDTRGD